MNKLLHFNALHISVIAFSSCEKCSTCTTTSEDPETFGTVITDEVCGSGRDYDDQIEIYNTANWDCVEND